MFTEGLLTWVMLFIAAADLDPQWAIAASLFAIASHLGRIFDICEEVEE